MKAAISFYYRKKENLHAQENYYDKYGMTTTLGLVFFASGKRGREIAQKRSGPGTCKHVGGDVS